MKQNKTKATRILRTSAGMTLVEIMMVVGITGIVMSSIISMLQISAKQQLQATLTFQAQQIEKNLVKLLNDPNAWKYTYAANAANGATYMSCLQDNQPCTTSGQEPPTGVAVGNGASVDTPQLGAPIYKIMDQTNLQVYDLTANSTGFAPTGKQCTTWIDAPGIPTNNNCPLKFRVTWSAKCNGAGGSCVSPTVIIFIQAWYNPDPKLRVTFNAANYSTYFYQGSNGSQACEWGWSVTKNQLTEVCAPFVGIGVDSVTHLNTRMEVYGTQKIYGVGTAGDTNGNNAVYLNAPNLDTGLSGVAIGYGNKFNSVNMANTAYISAEQQGGTYKPLVLNPIQYPGNVGYVGINTTAPAANLDVQVDASHKLLFRSAQYEGNASAISAVNGNNSAWMPLELDGAPVIMKAVGGTNLSDGAFQVQGTTTLSGNTTIQGDEYVNNVQIYGSETINGNQTTLGQGQINGNLLLGSNLRIGALNNDWITSYLNQGVRSDQAPTFAGLTVNGTTSINNATTVLNNGPLVMNNGDQTMNNGSFYVNNGSNSRFTVKNSGNVGVGTTNPQWLFEVHQNGASGGQAMIALTDQNVTVGYNISAGNGTAVGQIGTISGHPFQLYAGNNAYTTLYANGLFRHSADMGVLGVLRAQGGFVNSSDIRLKTDIHPIEKPLENLLKLQGVKFKWRNTNRDDIGFIAQDVQKVYPQLVSASESAGKTDDGKPSYLGVEYTNIVAIVVEAIKELSKKVDVLIAKVDQLLVQQASLARENENLRIRLDALEHPSSTN